MPPSSIQFLVIALAQRAFGGDLFCIDSIAIPQVFLLGSQKCSTSSLASQLYKEAHATYGKQKESHFFDEGWGERTDIHNFARNFGKAGSCGPHAVAFDGTPNYVLDYVNPTRRRFLSYIRDAYGQERLRRTTFVMVLCDPVQRAQSYEYHPGLGCGGCFREYVRSPDDFFQHQALKNGRYADQVRDVLEFFGQITIIPAAIYWHHADLVVSELLGVIARRSGKLPTGRTFSKHPPRSNSHHHPKLEDDCPPATRGPALAAYFRDSTQYIYDKVEMPPACSAR